MGERIDIQLNEDGPALMARVREAAQQNGMLLTGDANAGQFSGSGVEGHYSIVGDRLAIDITKKPLILPWRVIEHKVREFFAAGSPAPAVEALAQAIPERVAAAEFAAVSAAEAAEPFGEAEAIEPPAEPLEAVPPAAEPRITGFAATPPREPRFVGVVHQALPGRIRLKVFGLKRNLPFKAEIENFLSGLDYVNSAKASELTGNILILFRPSIGAERLVRELDDFALRENNGRLPNARAPQKTTRLVETVTVDAAPRAKAVAATALATAPKTDWHLRTAAEVAERLESTHEGLPAAQASARLAQYGPNALSIAEPRSKLAMILEQLMNPPVALLGASAVISIATGGIVDAIVIAGVVGINAVIGFVTESQAERTINALNWMGRPPKARWSKSRCLPGWT